MPGTPNPNVFDPPTAAQVAERLASNPPVQVAAWQARLPLLLFLALGVLLFASGNPSLALLPWLGLFGVMAYLSSRARAARELQQRVVRMGELAMIRRYREALGQAWELVPACRTRPDLHGRVVSVMAHILNELRQDEAADEAYRYLLDRLPPDHPLSIRVRLQQATAMLRTDRLADADDLLRQMRSRAETSHDETVRGAYRLARLLQDVRTGHFADAANRADDTAAGLRPLGIEAGYGHGLLALCFHQLALHAPNLGQDERVQLARSADHWWSNATLLIPPSALVYRYPELQAMLDRKAPKALDNQTDKPTTADGGEA